MVDLISLSQGVSQLCSQLDNLHGDLAGRPAHDVQKSLQEGGWRTTSTPSGILCHWRRPLPPRSRQRLAPEVGPETPGAQLPSLGELVDAIIGLEGRSHCTVSNSCSQMWPNCPRNWSIPVCPYRCGGNS
jgi:hypothetical protein